MTKEKRVKVELIESYIKWGNSSYQWNDNHGELIRCKDCIHYNNAADECLIEGYGINRPEDWFCADGKRKENE